MLLTIGIVLIALWAVGFIGFHVVSSFIHILLVLAIIVILTHIIQGK